MAKFNTSRDAAVLAIESIAEQLAVARQAPETAHYYNDKNLSGYLSKESISDVEMADYSNSMEGIATHLSDPHLFGSDEFKAVVGGEVPTHSLEAAQILVAASSNLSGYNKTRASAKLRDGVPVAQMHGTFSGPAGSIGNFADVSSIAKESFDEKVLSDFLNYSIVFNVMASQQDEVNALFYKPLTITPDQTGYLVSMRMEQVWNGQEYAPNGDYTPQNKRNLIDALTHPEILETNLTNVIPYVQEGGGSVVNGVDPIKNLHHFVTKSGQPAATIDDVLTTTTRLEDLDVVTAPLAVNMTHNILGLSSHPSLIANGLMNEKDSLDSRVALYKVYLRVGDQIVKFNAENLYTSSFYASREGQMRKMTLAFDNQGLLISDRLLAVDGSEVAAFKPIVDAGYEVRLRIKLFGDITVDNSAVNIAATPVTIGAIVKDGVVISPNDADFLKVAGDLKLGTDEAKVKVVGYDLEARRTNYDLRSRGRLIDSTEYKEQLLVPLRSPISIQKPLAEIAAKEHPDVKSLVNAVRIMANNDGIKTLINHGAYLKQIVSKYDFDLAADRDSIPGIGRHYLRPCYIEESLHLPALINSSSSENRLKDIQGGISTKVNEMIGRVLKETNYIAVVEQLTGGNPGKVQVIIATDYRLPQYLNIQGDSRLFGGRIDYKIGSTPNKLMSDKIIMSLTRVGADAGPDPFSHGTFIWSPELMITTQLSRGAQTYTQHLVHPRYIHLINIPIQVVLNITGIEEVTGESTVQPVVLVTREEAALPGNAAIVPEPKPATGKQAQASAAAGAQAAPATAAPTTKP